MPTVDQDTFIRRARPGRQALAWPSRIFGTSTRFWAWFTPFLGALAILRGIHAPIPFALTQASIDYRFGFIRRGLHGELLGLLGLTHRGSLEFVAYAEFLGLVLFLCLLCKRCRVEERFGDISVLAVFTSSYAVTYLANLVGYLDILNAAILVFLIGIRSPRKRLLISLPGVIFTLLLHESFLLLFLPVLMLSFVADAVGGRIDASTGVRYAGAIGLLGLVTTLTSVGLGEHSPRVIADILVDLRRRADFPLQDDAVRTLSWSFVQDLRIMVHKYTHSPRWWWTMFESLLTLGPVSLMLLHLIRRCSRALMSDRADGQERVVAYLRLGARLAILSPLSMHLLGWDDFRWNSYFVLDLFLVFLLFTGGLNDGQPIVLEAWETRAILCAIVLSIASGYGLLDGHTINPFPFYPRLVPMLD